MNKYIFGLFVLCLGIVACTEATETEKNDAPVRPKIVMLPFHWSSLGFPLDRLQTGDLILRHSEGFSSDIFKGASKRENLYSHAGITIRNSDGTVDVYHMLGGVENPNFNLKKDSVQAFVSPTFAKAFAIYHYDLTDEERIHIDSLVRYYYKSNLQFDMDFDLKSDKKMYCSELVWKIYKEMGINLCEPKTFSNYNISSPEVQKAIKQRYGTTFNMDEQVVAPVDIYESSLVKTVFNTL